MNKKVDSKQAWDVTLLGAKTVGQKQSNLKYLYWENKKSIALRINDLKAIRPNKNLLFELYEKPVFANRSTLDRSLLYLN
jgi:hypothetical protein